MKPVITKSIAAFDGEVDDEFWGYIASPVHTGSGSPTLGRWITAFLRYRQGEVNWTGVGGGDSRRLERRVCILFGRDKLSNPGSNEYPHWKVGGGSQDHGPSFSI